MKLTLLLFAVLALPAYADFKIEHLKVLDAKGEADVRVFSVPLRSARVTVAPALRMAQSNRYQSEVAVSVQDFAKGSDETRAVWPAASDFLVVNGGFSSEQLGQPIGLLVADGMSVSTPSYARTKVDKGSNCKFRQQERFRLSALLCVPQGAPAKLVEFNGTSFQGCMHAIQAGPMLIESKEIAVCRSATREAKSRRTVLCISGDDRQEQLKVVIVESPVTLNELAFWLQSPAAVGGPGCTQAMNLGGDTSTGAAFFSRGQQMKRGLATITAGPGTYPQSSFIVISEH